VNALKNVELNFSILLFPDEPNWIL
jgi:hypothetical protein